MASNIKVAVIESPDRALNQVLSPSFPDSPTESLPEAPSAVTSPMSVVIKGLPADHSLWKCMGEYVEQAKRIGGRPAFVGGRCNDMALDFSIGVGWTVRAKEEEWFALLYSKGAEALPQLSTSDWIVCEQRKNPSSVRVEKFKKRETMLKLSGGQGSQAGVYFEGVYRKQANSQDGKPMYCDGSNVIWFKEGCGWCVGFEERIGTRRCMMHADDFAPTPDAVQSDWMVITDSVEDPRVQVVVASAECTPSPSVQQHHPAPARQQELHSAPENTLPLTIAVVGVGEGLSGLYKKQQRTHDGKVMYVGSRADGNRVIWYTSSGGLWRIGPCGSNGAMASFVSTNDSAASPHKLADAVWREDVREPCNSVRVTKSKKKHTKVIEVKGVPTDQCHHIALAQLNGKYRQQALIIDGRPTFKGGEGSKQAIWFSESAGSWRIGDGDFMGTAVFFVHAKDTASMPNTVKSTWEVANGICYSPYVKIILPTVEAAEQEVPRQMQLKMAEVLVAEQKRCLGCGHEYTLHMEVVYHEECMHHHCVCCGEEQGIDACAVCAAQEGK
jgi:hypothetical protein